MLLRHTSTDVAERNALTVNPAKTCQPIGAMYAALGIHGCLPHSHGSQGCCSYHRSTLTRHYKEPVMAATSSFTEGASVFGGQANLLKAIETIFSVYKPEVIAVHSTCLSETIGDDLNQIVQKARDDGKVPEGKKVIFASTPSYVGSHVTGYANMVQGIIRGLVERHAEPTGKLNIIPGWCEPADMAEIKRIALTMGADVTVFPDTSNVMNAPMTGKHEFYPRGGTTIEELSRAGDAAYTIGLGQFTAGPGTLMMDKNFSTPHSLQDLPYGLAATDRYIMALKRVTGGDVPDELNTERGRLLDMMTDMHQYLHGKRVALFGDPDLLVPLTEFLRDLDMRPVQVISGTPGKAFAKRMKELFEGRNAQVNIKNGQGADMFLLHQWMKNEPVDLLIGNSYGKYMARDEDTSFLRMGFPILDRVGHSYFPYVGYTGAMRLLEKMLGLFMDRQDRDAPEERFELAM